MILLIDNYDSFTWNLVHLMAGLGREVRVVRNDALPAREVLALEPEAIVLGPGPGRPAGAGMCLELLDRLPPSLPLLGVCLGFQALVEQAGGALERDPEPVHGRASAVHHTHRGPFADLPDPFPAGRYHSLRVRAGTLPVGFEPLAWTPEGVLMAAGHRELPRLGLQFHPESVLTPDGAALVRGFLDGARALREPRTP